MDIQYHSKTGDEVHICHRCGWPFPNSHPSSKHRRAHKRICGTIQGYPKLIQSEPISDSDDDHLSDQDKQKTPSPKTDKGIIKESGNSAGGAEDDLFSDAVTEFSDSGISPGATKLLDSPINVGKADDNLEVFETPETHTKDADINIVHNSSGTQIKLLDSDMKPSDSDPLVEDGDGSAKDKLIVECSNSVEIKPDFANAMDDTFEVSDDKDKEEKVVHVLSVPSDIPLVDHSETLIDDFKDHETIYSKVPMILDHDTFEVKTAEDRIQESQPSENGESSIDESAVSVDKRFVGIRTETAEFDHEHGPEVVKETEIGDKEDPASYTQEIVKEPESGFEAEQKMVGSVLGLDSKESGNLGISQRSEKLIPEKAEQWTASSGVVSGTLVDSVSSSSRNSLEGNWGSVSVLSTASIDAENAHSMDRSRLGKWDGFQGESLVQVKEEIVEERSSEIQNSEDAKMVNNESDGKKRNEEEIIAKVRNWSTGENSTLKNVVKSSREGEKSKSPPKYIREEKKVKKKGKGKGSWIPFGCCSSVNVN